LRDVSLDEFARFENDLPPVVAKRARHIITENARVIDAVASARQNDCVTFGKLMDASHASMRDDYQISCAELDTMVEIARKQPGCFGARLTGAGFGGCTVNLVAADKAAAFVTNVAHEYQSRTNLNPPIYACTPAAGAGQVS
jgi:galactokinase